MTKTKYSQTKNIATMGIKVAKPYRIVTRSRKKVTKLVALHISSRVIPLTCGGVRRGVARACFLSWGPLSAAYGPPLSLLLNYCAITTILNLRPAAICHLDWETHCFIYTYWILNATNKHRVWRFTSCFHAIYFIASRSILRFWPDMKQ